MASNRKFAKYAQSVFEPLANEHGLVWEYENLWPGARSEQVAFQLAKNGGCLLLSLTEPETFPSDNKRISKRTAKEIASRLSTNEAQLASVFLGHALSTLLAEQALRAGNEPEARLQLAFREELQEQYPLPDVELEFVESLRAEYRTLDEHKLRNEILQGAETGTGFHMALQDPSFIDGRDLDLEENLIEIQEHYAASYLRGHAMLHAIEIVLGKERFVDLSSELLFPDSKNIEVFVLRVSQASVWSGFTREWLSVVEVAMGSIDRAKRPLECSDSKAEELREGILSGLDGPKKLSALDSQLVVIFSDDAAATKDLDKNWAAQSILSGFFLREAECASGQFNDFDPEYEQQMRELALKEPSKALGMAAISVSNDLPAPFGYGSEVWSELVSWSVDDTIARAWLNWRLERYEGEETQKPALDEAGLRECFALGYGLGFAGYLVEDTAHVTNLRP